MKPPRFLPSLLYLFCRYVGCLTLRFLFYRKVIVRYDEPLPKKGSVVFLSNHQNAFMDAFLIICTTKQHYPVFFARSDEFQIPVLRTILRWLRVAPLYRMNRGIRQVSNNLQSFDLAAAVLQAGRSIALFPEGTHYDRMHVHPLKKGAARIIAHAYIQPGWNNDISIIPVSITYQNYFLSRSTVYIHFGKPQSTYDYKTLLLHNYAKTLNDMTVQMYEHLQSVCVHINDLQNYTYLDCFLRVYCSANARTSAEYFVLMKQAADTLNALSEKQPELYTNILQTASKITKTLTNHQLEPETFGKYLGQPVKKVTLFLTIFVAPLQLLRSILIFLPFTLIDKISGRIAEDPQFRSSITFSAAFFLTPVLTILQLSGIYLLTGHLVVSLLSLIIMLFTPIYDIWSDNYRILCLRRKSRFIPTETIEEYKKFLKIASQILNAHQ